MEIHQYDINVMNVCLLVQVWRYMCVCVCVSKAYQQSLTLSKANKTDLKQ